MGVTLEGSIGTNGQRKQGNFTRPLLTLRAPILVNHRCGVISPQ